ncbi:MAG: hypothetical protein IJ735_05880 [Clostridia bacterium]|nr:hypothetical protein [Clostridia bacterium]
MDKDMDSTTDTLDLTQEKNDSGKSSPEGETSVQTPLSEEDLPLVEKGREANEPDRETMESVYADENVSDEDEETIQESIERIKGKRKSRRRSKREARIKRIIDMSAEQDIKYRGPLSYRTLRIIAWICFGISMVGWVFKTIAKGDPNAEESDLTVWAAILSFFTNLMMPMFLLANFANILNNSRKFRSLLLMYAGFAVLIYILFLLLHDRYMVGLMMNLGDITRPEAQESVDNLLVSFVKNGFFSFNIFVDLFLCTLFTYFVTHRPKKIFVGKKLVWFRLFAILPVAYEVASIVVKILGTLGFVTITSYAYPLLTTKPPMTFVVFVILTFFVKKREVLYRQFGKTHEDYLAYLKTNYNSLQFSSFTAKLFALGAICDVVLFGVFALIISLATDVSGDGVTNVFSALNACGIGASFSLLFAAPIVMLFSYTRTYKDTRIDLIISICGIILIALIVLEGVYNVLLRYSGIIVSFFSSTGG